MMSEILQIYGIVVFVACFIFFLITTTNIIWLAHTLTSDRKRSGPSVAVLVPARNEAARIGPCLDSLLKQDYLPYQIYVIDDNSTDDTWEILRDYMLRYPRKLKAFKAEALPEGWYGKPHALQELARHVEEEYLLCTDADTTHRPDSISKAISIAEKYRADLVTGYVRHLVPKFSEASVETSIYILTMFVLPLYLIPITRSRALSHAIGQFMLFRRDFFTRIGGYELVKHQATEDVHMARIVKQYGGKEVFVDLKDTVACRMYTNYRESVQGIAKNAFDYLGKNFLLLLLGTIAVPLLFFVPILAWLPGFQWLDTAQPLLRASAIISIYTWILEAVDRRLPWYIPFIHPLVLINTLSALWRGFHLVRTEGGVEWKGRRVR